MTLLAVLLVLHFVACRVEARLQRLASLARTPAEYAELVRSVGRRGKIEA
jgi:hypothetical protein